MRSTTVNAAAADKKRVKVIFDAISTYLLCLMVTHKCLSHETAQLNPKDAKAGGLQSQGVKGEIVVGYLDLLTTQDLKSSGFPEG